ncbi:peptidoglycan glycosyltransferase [Geoalkalibacter ferrihydriticus]|uniref:Beta-lactamase n=2 Tax=Geoalkalibacter ferrihydriticus TaxID=392333 RepID=A0A0C2HIH0_9BACT|nr:penicillin-binding protein 2 [Geoalkalibacter ferrihydriticus]KIH76831.1 penicillin-binding protein [Geoalkalibacter ferrihydriticus DSM 17813]SDL48783.1 peptidoglycan glycosyltransferase [Geoalkalibacter ferrihydriticus]
MNSDSDWSGKPDLTKRFVALSLVAVVVFLLLLLRLWYLQVINAERYQALSERNRIRYMPIAAPRGPIFDRDGHLLVDNRPSFGVSVMRQDVDDRDRLLERLSFHLETDRAQLEARLEAGRRFPFYRPVPLADDVSREMLERVQENSLDLHGVLIDVQPLRSYPYEDAAAHIFGYLGEVTERDLARLQGLGYRPGDFVGKTGMEQTLEDYLRGAAGQRLVEVDVLGKELRVLQVQDPVPGNKVYLTLKRDVQLAAERALRGHAGSAVALDVRTGEVLALASVPSFNPALFARGITGTEWIELLQNPRHPLQNKAIKGQYPPASTFKIVTALAALRAGVATPNTQVTCSGSFTLGNHVFRCWKRTGHGVTDMRKAMRESCDIWFYKVGLDLGIERLAEMGQEFGLGQSLGFELAGEKQGLMPTRAWKRQRMGQPWYDGETVIAAIGQGFVLTTPLQLAVMTAAVANGGALLQPQIVKRVEGWDGQVFREAQPEVIRQIDFGDGNLAAVRRSLDAAVNEPQATGRASRIEGVRVAGKTGTAQVVRLRDDKDKIVRETPYRFRDHALFVAYAPADDPEIAVAVVVEHGQSGGATAAPIARAMIEAYLGLPVSEPVAPAGHYGD